MMTLPDHARSMLERDAATPALEYQGRWLGWGELSTTARAVMAALDGSGITADAPVALIARNNPAAIAALIALLAQGRTIRMLYPFQSDAAMAASLARLEVCGVVLDARDCGEAVLASAHASGLAVVTLEGMKVHMLAGFDRQSGASAVSIPASPQIEILTSGTTGAPKPFAIPYRLIEEHFISTPLTRTQGADPVAAPPFLLYFPLGNISGIYSTLPTLIRGQRAVLLERFSVSAWHDYVLRYRPVHSGVPPSCVQQLLDADIPRDDLASIKAMGVGAAPLDPAVQRAFEDRYGIPILLSYGATEFAGPVAMMTAELHALWGARKHGSVGLALPGARLRVVDPDTGSELPAGQAGLLQVVSPRMGADWIATSDLAVIDEDGFLFLKGRADGAIMRGGFKIVPETIEAALMQHPAVAEVAVVGLPDERLGQVPAAAIRCSSSHPLPSEALLEEHLRARLLATHIPSFWRFCDDLPRTPSLKVDRSAVRLLFESG